VAELKAMPFKVDHFASIYSRMRRRIVPHPTYILASNLSLLEGNGVCVHLHGCR